ncbi:hypothetical protein V493_00495 [Pseudogymnoascus sp. VKM F-4281 (FW-2241)]|nr:hypothetical protein V493_00495 [Pseudogymnoascus sp. VKM F-4281 (FW-2241)]
MPTLLYEARLVLALEAMNNNRKLSLRATAKIYNVSRTILTQRRDRRTARCDTIPNLRKLTELEEEAIVQYITELATRSFPPRLSSVEDMANQLLQARDASTVAQCEDPKAINAWFTLVLNTKAKYSIVDEDIYNFDETGFMMGIIFPGMVVTTADGCGKAKLAQPSNCEWATVIQGVNALGWAIPPFIILAAQYHLANWYEECNLPTDWCITTTENSWTTNEGRYRLLILDGHESHYSTKFELYCQKCNIITLWPTTTNLWVPMTPQNPLEAESQTQLIKSRISNHHNSTPTPMLDAVDQFAKGAKAIMHQVALLRAEVSSLRKANEGLSKRRRAKKTRVQLGGSLTIQDATDLLDQRAIEEQVMLEMRQRNGCQLGSTKARCCGTCGHGDERGKVKILEIWSGVQPRAFLAAHRGTSPDGAPESSGRAISAVGKLSSHSRSSRILGRETIFV